MPVTCSSPTWARRASTSRSRTSTGGSSATATSRPTSRRARRRACTRVDELFGELTTATRDLPGRLWGIGIGVPGPVEFRTGRPVSPPIMPGWDGYPVRERFAARYGCAGLGRQRRQPPRPRRVAIGHRGRPRQRDRRQDRHGHRRRDHLERPHPPRRAGQRRRRRPHPGRRRHLGRLPLRERRLPRGPRRGRGAGARRRGGRARRSQRAASGGARPARPRDRGGRGARGLVRRPRRGGAAPVGRPPRRASCSPASSTSSTRRSSSSAEASRRAATSCWPRSARRCIAGRCRSPRASWSIQRSSLGALAGVIGASSMVVEQLFSREALARLVRLGGPEQALDQVAAGS